jgi:hypothetical protein
MKGMRCVEEKKMSDREYAAYVLTRPFNEWFRWMFKNIEGRMFINEVALGVVFEMFEGVYGFKKEYQYMNLNIPPRCGKTTMIPYFMIYTALHGRSEFLYLSFNNQIMLDLRRRLEGICRSEFFEYYYGVESFLSSEDGVEYDDRYFEKLNKEQLVVFNRTKCVLGDSVIYICPLGLTTGIGAGVRNELGRYSGGIFMDDINKIGDTLLNRKINDRIKSYFDTNVLTRINNARVNIMNVQQRISVHDMTSYLEGKYEFKTVKVSVENSDGSINFKHQYPLERVGMLKKSMGMWMAQYQQSPVEVVDLSFSGQVFSREVVESSVRRSVPFSVARYKRILGVDPKREGSDKFVIAYRENKYSRILFSTVKPIYTEVAVDVVEGYMKEYSVDEVYIDKGYGMGIIDVLKGRGYYKVYEVDFSRSSGRGDCYNKRTQMYVDMLDWLDSGGVLPDDVELLEDLLIQEYEVTESNLKKLVKKDKIRERIRRSPDKSDALALTFANGFDRDIKVGGVLGGSVRITSTCSEDVLDGTVSEINESGRRLGVCDVGRLSGVRIKTMDIDDII